MSFTFDHLGVATHNLIESQKFLKKLGYSNFVNITDENLGVDLIFANGGGPTIELVMPLPGNKTLNKFIEAGSFRPYHFAYVHNNLKEALRLFEEDGFLQITEPKPAIAFNGRKIVFLANKNKMLIEIIEGT